MILFVALLGLPFLLRFDPYALYVLTLGLLFASLSVSWNLLAYSGLISFGHAAFFGLGAYTSAIFSMKWGFSPWITILLGMGWASAFALLVGATCLHLKGPAFALGTLCWAEILKALAFNWTSLTQGAWGLVGIPSLPAIALGRLRVEFAFSRTAHYFLFLVLLAFFYLVERQLFTSRLGIAMRAIREGEERASSLGINVLLVRLGVLVVSGSLTGFLGALYAHLLHTLEPGTAFSLYISFIPLIMAMFGGMHHPFGPIVGALVLYLLNEFLFQPLLPWAHQVPYALGILLALFFLPQGIVGKLSEIRKGRGKGGPPHRLRP